MELRLVNLSNVWDIVRLRVRDDQRDFVADNGESIIEAYAARASGYVAMPFGLYEDGLLVGFVMIGYGSLGDANEPKIARNSYCLWRLMIDAAFQGQGLGKKAVQATLDYIRALPRPKFPVRCWVSWEPENTVARSLYHAFGFRENGEMDGEEIVAVLEL